MDAQALKGIAVVSLQEGTTLGRVEQALFDLVGRALRGVEVRGDAGTFVVPFTQIERIGSDAITVASSQVTQTPSAGSPSGTLLGLHELGKLKVVDDAGTFLGTISTIEFDPTNGEVSQVSAHKGGLLGIGGTTTTVDVATILMVGEELITVRSTADDSPSPPSPP
jgi:sporulation protein YlmC with PRC-barrel domain